MPISDHIGGFIKPGYFPLQIPDAPTIGAATSGGSLAISIAFTAPSDVGGGAITSYEAIATDTVTAATFTASGASSPVTITGLTEDQTYTVTVSATNAYGQSVLSAASNSFQAAVALEFWAWGYNGDGQLGQENTTNYSSPVQVGALTDWAQVSAGTNGSTLAIKTNGTLWGIGNDGSLGLNDTVNRSSPTQVGALTNWSQVGVGAYFAMAVKTDGTLWSVGGSGGSGQLGHNNTTNYSSPVQVGALTNWLQVAGGYEFATAVKTDGTLWAWGKNAYGQLGQENTTNYSSPVQVGALTDWAKVACGQWFMIATKTDGTLWGCGRNNDGALMQNGTTDCSSPIQVGALTNWSKISGGGDTNTGFSAAIKTDGTAWLCGAGNYGVMGQSNALIYSSPVQLGALTTWSEINCQKRTVTAIKTDGTMWAWGWNGYGALGQGNTTDRSSPVQVGALTTWTTQSTSTQAEFSSMGLKTVS